MTLFSLINTLRLEMLHFARINKHLRGKGCPSPLCNTAPPPHSILYLLRLLIFLLNLRSYLQLYPYETHHYSYFCPLSMTAITRTASPSPPPPPSIHALNRISPHRIKSLSSRVQTCDASEAGVWAEAVGSTGGGLEEKLSGGLLAGLSGKADGRWLWEGKDKGTVGGRGCGVGWRIRLWERLCGGLRERAGGRGLGVGSWG